MKVKKEFLPVLGVAAVLLVLGILLIGGTPLPAEEGKKTAETMCEIQGNSCCVIGTGNCLEAKETNCLKGYKAVFECTFREGQCVPKGKCVKTGTESVEKTLEERIADCQGHAFIGETSDCLLELAIEGKDPLICEKIQAKENTEDVEKIINDCKRDVKIELVVLEGKLEKCSELGNKFDEFTCVKRIALSREAPVLCEKITDLGVYVECYIGIALKKNDVSVCDSIKQNTLKQSCITKVALGSLDESICEGLENISTKNNCFHEIALAKKDSRICSRISDSTLRTVCERDFLEE